MKKKVPEQGYEIKIYGSPKSMPRGRRDHAYFLELSKFRFYLLLHIIFIGAILLYQSIWQTGVTTIAYCYAYNEEQLVKRGESPGTLVYHYLVDSKMYRETTERNELPLTQHQIRIRYLPFYPSISRPDTFKGNWLGFIIAWGLFFIISTMIFFIPNETMPSNSYFYFSRKKPWIHMIVK